MTGNALRLARSMRCALPALCPASGAGRPAGLCSPLSLSLSLSLSLTDSLSLSLSLREEGSAAVQRTVAPCLQRQRRLVSTAPALDAAVLRDCLCDPALDWSFLRDCL